MIKQLEDCLLFKTRVFEHKLNLIADDHFSEFGFHMTYAYILKVVYFKEEINPKELAGVLYVAPSTITRMVEKLIQQGLLMQGNEKSKKVIYLSYEGEQLIPSLLKAWEGFHLAIEEEFGKELTKNISDSMLSAVKE